MPKNKHIGNDSNLTTIIYVTGSVLLIAIIAFVIITLSYGNKMKGQQSVLSAEKIAELVPNTKETNSMEQASSSIGKNVEEVINEMNNNVISTNQNVIINETENVSQVSTQEKVEVIENKEPVFTKPVEGEIIREFAKDTLVYSKTLKEWVTHLGIDIKADKTTVVKASADGKVSAIKNDPRYGLTVILEHNKGYKTIYSNLLTAEFVNVGDDIKTGQTLGTIGNSSAFEIADDYHLHFEILKDNENIDPKTII